jgi:hypothetical protein
MASGARRVVLCKGSICRLKCPNGESVKVTKVKDYRRSGAGKRSISIWSDPLHPNSVKKRPSRILPGGGCRLQTLDHGAQFGNLRLELLILNLQLIHVGPENDRGGLKSADLGLQ